MKKLAFGLLVFFSSFTAIEATTIRFSTYNILNPVFEENYSGKDTWKERFPFIVENLLSSESDVICLEEVAKPCYLDLLYHEEISARFMCLYIAHAPSDPDQKEGCDGIALLYNPEKVSLAKLIHSKKGARPSQRKDFYVDLKLNDNRQVPVQFRVACTHLDGENQETGDKQLSLLVDDCLKIDRKQNLDFVVVCGDFNEGEGELERPRYALMANAGFYTDDSVEATRPEMLDVEHHGHIDWIYFKKISSLDFELISVPCTGDERASDHKLTTTDIEIN